MRLAVIDLGTNTCNLLIAELKDNDYNILHQSKQLVKLGDDKIKANEISSEAIQRTLQSFRTHRDIIDGFNVDSTVVITTSAVRSAGNKIAFLEKLSSETGWIIKIISGKKEAELIFKGVLLAFQNIEKPSVILDIGGGSNELIFTHKKDILWKESQAAGMARVINQFKISDPILSDEIKIIQDFFYSEHRNAFQICIDNSVKSLIGCSGAFDTIADIIDEVNPGEKQRKTQNISITEFYGVYEKLIRSTRKQRLKIKGMDIVRLDLIVPGIILIEQLISKIGITSITQTDFALREGILFEILNI